MYMDFFGLFPPCWRVYPCTGMFYQGVDMDISLLPPPKTSKSPCTRTFKAIVCMDFSRFAVFWLPNLLFCRRKAHSAPYACCLPYAAGQSVCQRALPQGAARWSALDRREAQWHHAPATRSLCKARAPMPLKVNRPCIFKFAKARKRPWQETVRVFDVDGSIR